MEAMGMQRDKGEVGALAQMARAVGSQSTGRGFEALMLHQSPVPYEELDHSEREEMRTILFIT